MAKPMALVIDGADLPAEDAEDLRMINHEIDIVAGRRIAQIDLFEEPYRRSKIAWKVALFSNAMTHRFVTLAEGTALSWNHGNTLSAVLNARALIETTAMFFQFGRFFAQGVQDSNFGKIDALVMRYLFSTRDEIILKDQPELKAPHVLDAIRLVNDTLIPNFLSHYDQLSERCHPNSAGHRMLFSKLDRNTGLTAFGSNKDLLFITPIKCALGTAVVFKRALNSIDEDIPKLAEAHNAAFPSPLADN